MNKKDLIDFEKRVQDVYESGKIKAPVHLSGNNEDQLIKIFKKIHKDDWVFSSWRNHYHALLHGFNPEKLFNHTRWKPEIHFEQTMNDLLDYWRN